MEIDEDAFASPKLREIHLFGTRLKPSAVIRSATARIISFLHQPGQWPLDAVPSLTCLRVWDCRGTVPDNLALLTGLKVSSVQICAD